MTAGILQRYILYLLLTCMHANKSQELEPGTKVMLENTCQKERKGGKLEDAYMGPYVIHSSVGKGVYTLRTMKGKVLKKKCNVKRLKVYIHNYQLCKTALCNAKRQANIGGRVWSKFMASSRT